MEAYEWVSDLSKGGQGSTMIAREVESGEEFVIKTVACDSMQACNLALMACDLALMEAKVLQNLEHPNVVVYIDVFLHQDPANNGLQDPANNGLQGRANVVVYIDVFLHQDPANNGLQDPANNGLQVCTVMDYCAGGDLAHRLHDVRLTNEALPETQTRTWLAQIAQGLAYMHENEMIHRDVKPQNIFITRNEMIHRDVKPQNIFITKLLYSKT
ncbi:kinase-like domain-containing protein [Baffinella frigidus]|nr:kinase-like domain-containing protein [Cryptophyta sp. CCMP2293]